MEARTEAPQTLGLESHGGQAQAGRTGREDNRAAVTSPMSSRWVWDG